MHICEQIYNCKLICDGNYEYLRDDMRTRILNRTCVSIQASTLCTNITLNEHLHERTFEARIPLRTLTFILNARFYQKEVKISPLQAM
jgi:hypothetical protein